MKKDQKVKESEVNRGISERVFNRVFLLWTVILVLLHLITIYIAPAYMWGVHFYHFFPVWIGWVLSLTVLALLIPDLNDFLYERFEIVAKKIKTPFTKLGENKTFLIVSLLSLPIFWIFRTRLYLLGDGYFRIQDLLEGKLHLAEWLDGFIHLTIYRTMNQLIPSWTPELTYSVISILCGGLFVFLSLKLSFLLGKNGFQKFLIFFFLVSLGSVELFFGYVESYSILQVALLIYILFAVLFLSGKTSILPVLLALVISIGLHISSLIFIPSFIYLLWESRKETKPEKFSSGIKNTPAPVGGFKKEKIHQRKEIQKRRPMLNAPTLIALALALVLIAFWVYKVATGLEKTGKGIFILPFKATPNYRFGMFSIAHISEFVNQLLLLSPLGISLILFFSAGSKFGLFFKLKFWNFNDKLTNFLILASSFALIYLFVFNFTLGSADWDLRASPAPFIGLLGVLLFLRWGEDLSADRRPPSAAKQTLPSVDRRTKIWDMRYTVHAWGLIFICFTLFHTVPWILINAEHSKSVARYVLIQENDPHPVDESGYNLYKIDRILTLAGLSEEVEKVYQRATEKNPYDRLSYYNLAWWYNEKQEVDQAIRVLDTLLKIDPIYPMANWLRGNIYIQRGEYEKALPYLERALPFFTKNPDTGYLFDLGMAYYKTNQVKAVGACALQVLKLAPESVKGYQLLGLAYVGWGDFENAKKAFEHLLTINPSDSIAIQNLKLLEKYLKK
jgi:tetratricopeptide (TPR) repeat protein